MGDTVVEGITGYGATAFEGVVAAEVMPETEADAGQEDTAVATARVEDVGRIVAMCIGDIGAVRVHAMWGVDESGDKST